MKKREKKLKQFYKELADWINAGMPEHKTFRKDTALCVQLTRWAFGLPWYARLYYNTDAIERLQMEIFWDKFGNSNFPFGMFEYNLGYRAKNHYTNEARLAFIFKQAGVPREI